MAKKWYKRSGQLIGCQQVWAKKWHGVARGGPRRARTTEVRRRYRYGSILMHLLEDKLGKVFNNHFSITKLIRLLIVTILDCGHFSSRENRVVIWIASVFSQVKHHTGRCV